MVVPSIGGAQGPTTDLDFDGLLLEVPEAEAPDVRWDHTFWVGDGSFTLGFGSDRDLSELYVDNGQGSEIVIDAGGENGPSCLGDCVLQASFSGPSAG